MTSHLAPIAWFAWACTVLVGCGGGGKSKTADAPTRAAFKVLGMQYGEYLAQHNGTPPPDESAMRKFLESQLPQLEAYHVKTVDDLLKAGRDGEPVVVICGAKVTSPDRPTAPWAAYERTGIGGKRLVSDSRGTVSEFTADEFAKQVPVM